MVSGLLLSLVEASDTMISHLLAVVLSPVPVALRSLALCRACEECFDIGPEQCPECGSDDWVPLAESLEARILNVTGPN